MIYLSIICLIAAIYCYTISQLHQHGKLKWMDENKPMGFWGKNSHQRKYKYNGDYALLHGQNWYYKLIGQYQTERFFLSTTLLVFLTDGYHLFQALFFSFLSLSFALAIGFNWWSFLGIFIGVRIVHWSARKILSK